MILNTKILISSLILLVAVPLCAQTLQWAKRYSPGPGMHTGNDIVADDSGNVYVTGRSAGVGTGSDYITLKYNAAGALQWEARYNGVANGDDGAHKLVQDKEGNIYVTGSSVGIGSVSDYVTIKYDNAGEEKWVARYNGSGNGSDNAVGLGLDNEGNIYVTGTSVGTTNADIVTVKYNPEGAEQWVKRYHENADSVDMAAALTVDKQNAVVVLGSTKDSGSAYDFVTIKYLSDGTQVWVKKYNGTSNRSDFGVDIGVDDSGNVYVGGQTIDTVTSIDYLTIKYSPSGVEQWVQQYDGYQGGDQLNAIDVSPAGNVAVTGTTVNLFEFTFNDYTTILYSSRGEVLWTKEYNVGYVDIAQDVVLDKRGNVFVTGYSLGSDVDVATLMYTPKGNEYLVGRYNASKYDFGSAIAVDNKSNVYVTGYSSTSQDNPTRDIMTLKYSPPASEVEENLQTVDNMLGQNYPNPFSRFTMISLGATGQLQVHDMLGRVVYQTKIDDKQTHLTFDGHNLPNGLYEYSLSDGVTIQSRIMTIVK